MVKKGDQIGMHYTGTIDRTSKSGTPGTQFDSSRERGQPLTFTIGGGQVIKGWDEGLIGFCKGAKATLVIPPEMGYGASGMGGQIPGGATLNFDVEVMTVETEPSMRSRSAEVSQPIAPERPATPDAEPHPTPSHTRRRATPNAKPAFDPALRGNPRPGRAASPSSRAAHSRRSRCPPPSGSWDRHRSLPGCRAPRRAVSGATERRAARRIRTTSLCRPAG